MQKPTPQISRAEWQVMKFIWKVDAPCSAQEVIDSLCAPNEWSVATVKTLLNRLVKKGALSFEKEGKAYQYSAATTETACRAAETDSFLDRVFDGSLTPLIAHFAQGRGLRKKDIEELESLLRESRKP
jgi:BlaI family transcriptional regulator, penicillinase repressor